MLGEETWNGVLDLWQNFEVEVNIQDFEIRKFATHSTLMACGSAQKKFFDLKSV